MLPIIDTPTTSTTSTLEIFIDGSGMDSQAKYPGIASLITPKRREAGYDAHYIRGCAVKTPYKRDLQGIFSWNLEDQWRYFKGAVSLLIA